MVQPAKIKKVEELREILQDAKSIILNDFTGLNVEDISELRRVCRENGITYRVVKNTLAKRGFKELGYEEEETLFEGPTAVAISAENEVQAAQVLKKFADDYLLPKFKGGYVGSRVLSEGDVTRLAMLPGRDILLSQVVGTFQAPLRGLLTCLEASLRDLVQVLKAVGEKKGAA